ncbi:hypothetical protein BDN72DRAFT_829976 [Pluteus cervinus]|uniref:Uncharacterized protein n=1 Tax=Pluteus cervinus TaxID=181527 RepID=A0ACD3BF41_9AGAR|nr:hypothetical protein BDN72DRAFT_829976 [Pluteus cervinus]
MFLFRFTQNVAGVARPFIRSRPHFRRPILWGVACTTLAATWALTRPTVIYLDASPQADADVVLDPQTSIAFPKTITIPSKIKIPTAELVGLGVRTVSFLGIKVYSVALYADLSNPNLKVSLNLAPEEKVSHVVHNTTCVIRIVPTRSTSYTHLRDAFMRALNARLAQDVQSKTITEDEALTAASPLRKLKTLFPNTPLKKHEPLDVLLTAPTPGKPRALIFRDLGSVENDWVATEFVLHYFQENAPSPAFKRSVLEKLTPFEKQ